MNPGSRLLDPGSPIEDTMISQRGRQFPSVGNDFPPWEAVSQQGTWFPIVGNVFLTTGNPFSPLALFLDPHF